MSEPKSPQPAAIPEADGSGQKSAAASSGPEISARLDPAHPNGPEPLSLKRESQPILATQHISPAQEASSEEQSRGGLEAASVPDDAELPELLRDEIEEPGEVSLSRERLRRQARQLAEYLQRRQADLDRREARLNAQIAQLENDLRASRLFFGERLAEWEEKRQILAEEAAALARRRADLGEQAEKLQEKESLLIQWEETLRQREAELKRREEERERCKKELLQREAHVRLREEDFASLAALVESASPEGTFPFATHPYFSSADSEEAERRELLEEARKMLRELKESRQRFKEEQRLLRRQWAEEQHQALAELAARREVLEQRSRALVEFHEKLVQLKQELQQKHLAALEHHLAAQEAVATLDPQRLPELTERILALRKERESLLDAEGREREEWRDKAAELQAKLEELHHRVQESMAQLVRTLTARWEELNRLAQQLDEEKRKLAERELRLAERDHAWQLHRLGYRAQIQRLRRELRRATHASRAETDCPSITPRSSNNDREMPNNS